jgi:hypothetical protein
MRYIAIFLLLVSTTVQAQWTSVESRELVYAGLLYVDYKQTLYITEHPKQFSEANFLLGSHPSPSRVRNYFAISMLSHSVITYMLPEKYKPAWQWGTIAFEAAVDLRNRHVGVHFTF